VAQLWRRECVTYEDNLRAGNVADRTRLPNPLFRCNGNLKGFAPPARLAGSPRDRLRVPVAVPGTLKSLFKAEPNALRPPVAFGLHYVQRNPMSSSTLRLAGIPNEANPLGVVRLCFVLGLFTAACQQTGSPARDAAVAGGGQTSSSSAQSGGSSSTGGQTPTGGTRSSGGVSSTASSAVPDAAVSGGSGPGGAAA